MIPLKCKYAKYSINHCGRHEALTDRTENSVTNTASVVATGSSADLAIAVAESFESAPTKQLDNKEFDKSFGNYLLHGIEEVYLPESVSWKPETFAWYVLLILMLAVIAQSLISLFSRWRRKAYRRRAISRLDDIDFSDDGWRDSIQKLPLVLKATALDGFPRKQVAKLSGESWSDLLQQSCPESSFDNELAQCLEEVSYRGPEDWSFGKDKALALLAASRHWVLHHQSDMSGKR
jgi:hypothetical protein